MGNNSTIFYNYNSACNEVYSIMNENIYKNKIVILLDDTTHKRNDSYSDNLKRMNVINQILEKYQQKGHILYTTQILNELSKNKDKNKNDIDELKLYNNMEKCIYSKYVNENNYKQINLNTNAYSTNNDVVITLYPMIFINGMNIGSSIDLKKMEYRKDLEKLLL